jgi:hypothetical protein
VIGPWTVVADIHRELEVDPVFFSDRIATGYPNAKLALIAGRKCFSKYRSTDLTC